MKVILFGSPLNPLSAATAQFLKEKGILAAIVMPKGLSMRHYGGVTCFFSKICVGIYRYFHVLLRQLRFKRSKDYLSLLEFIKDNPAISVFYSTPQNINRKKLFFLENRDNIEYIVISCIFPFKIPSNIFGIRRLINIHPGLLPQNRGPNPYFQVLANKHEQSGITYHILTMQFDKGAILFRDAFPVDSNCSEYNLEKVTNTYLKKSLPIFFERFEEMWSNAMPQLDGIYYPEPSREDRKKHMRYSIFDKDA